MHASLLTFPVVQVHANAQCDWVTFDSHSHWSMWAQGHGSQSRTQKRFPAIFQYHEPGMHDGSFWAGAAAVWLDHLDLLVEYTVTVNFDQDSALSCCVVLLSLYGCLQNENHSLYSATPRATREWLWYYLSPKKILYSSVKIKEFTQESHLGWHIFAWKCNKTNYACLPSQKANISWLILQYLHSKYISERASKSISHILKTGSPHCMEACVDGWHYISHSPMKRLEKQTYKPQIQRHSNQLYHGYVNMSTFVTLETWFTLRQGAQQEIKGASSNIATCANHPAQTCIFQSRKNLSESQGMLCTWQESWTSSGVHVRDRVRKCRKNMSWNMRLCS
jgi:hypothetical protein